MSACSVWTQLSGLSLVLNLLTNLSWCHSKHTVGDRPEQRPLLDTHRSAASPSQVLQKVKCIAKCKCIKKKKYKKMLKTLLQTMASVKHLNIIIRESVIFWISNKTKSRCKSMQTLSYCMFPHLLRINQFLLVHYVSHTHAYYSMHMYIFGL